MLEFFRRHQRYFFIIITIVIIISFSFFGTYSTLGSDQWREQVAFRAVDGSDVTRYELDEMALFLSSDNEDKLLYGGAWGPNFLNDGVILKDFLQTGLAEELVAAYFSDLKDDLQRRLEREKRYVLYSHPHAKFIGVENAWEYFAPGMRSAYGALRQLADPHDPKSFKARVNLFLAQRQFPAPALKQVLRYQERQYNWLNPDPNLEAIDLSLFGYHTLDDWFGPQFVRLVSEFIINSAKIAEEKGYFVSKADAWADLLHNTEMSYLQNVNKPNFGVATPTEYLNEQLRIMRMDQTRAVKIWQQVMMFRLYFHDVGNAVLVDTFVAQKFNDYTKEAVEVELYRLPEPLRIGDYATLQKFEIYLDAVSRRSKDEKKLLALPKVFLSPVEVAKQYPELVQKKFQIEYVHVDKKHLQAKVSLKDTWAWELDDANWKLLQKQFPDLGIKSGKSREERLAAIDALDAITRARVDAFSRSAIVDNHPEWLQKALGEASSKISVIGLRTDGGALPFQGIDQNPDKRKELLALLTQLSVKESQADVGTLFSADNQNFYRIKVLAQAPREEVLTFSEALSDGTLTMLLDRALKKHYESIRQTHALLYQNQDGSWKEFPQVRDLIAESYFEDLLSAIKNDRQTYAKDKKEKTTHDEDASYRLFAHFRNGLALLKKDSSSPGVLLFSEEIGGKKEGVLGVEVPLDQQWLLEKKQVRLDRGAENPQIDLDEAFALNELEWSDIKVSTNGDIEAYQLTRKLVGEEKNIAIAEQTKREQTLLSSDAQKVLMQKVLKIIKDKNAISFDYIKRQQEVEEAVQIES